MTTLRDVLDDPFSSQADKDKAVAEEIHGVTSVLLWQKGWVTQAALLMDAVKLHLVWQNVQNAWTDQWEELCACFIDVEPYQLERWIDEIPESIEETLRDVAARYDRPLSRVEVRAALPKIDSDWREKLGPRLSEPAVSNQGQRLRAVKPMLTEDGLVFTNDGEVRVYQALKRAQAKFPDDDNIVIFPLPSGRVRVGSTWTPDFLVTYNKHVGLVEVDGDHHGKRYAADVSRDDVFRDGGVAEIGRIAVEDTRDAGLLEAWVERFLKRLRG